MLTRGLGRAVLVCAVVLGCASPAHAQPDRKASPQFLKTYDDAVTAYNDGIIKGDFSKAKKLFKKAIAFDDRAPGPYRYLALIAQKEERYQDCLDQAFTALKRNQDARTAPKTRELHSECRKELGRPPFRDEFAGGGAIAVLTPEVTTANVQLNGLTYGGTPLVRGFAEGEVLVEVNAPGYLPAKKEAEILRGVVTDVIFELERDPDAEVGPGIGTGTGTEVDPEVGWVELETRPDNATILVEGQPAELDDKGRIAREPGQVEIEVRAPEHEPWRRRVKFNEGQSRTIDVVLRSTDERQSLRRKGYISLGVAAALAASGTFFGILEMRKYEAAQDIWDTETQRPTGTDTGGVVPVRTREDIEDLEDKGRRYAIISATSFGLAAVALGASIYFFIQERPVEREGFPLPVAVGPATESGGLGVTYTTELDW